MPPFTVGPNLYGRNRNWITQYLRNVRDTLHEDGDQGDDVRGPMLDPAIMCAIAICELVDKTPDP